MVCASHFANDCVKECFACVNVWGFVDGVFYVEYLNGHETGNPFGEVGSQYSLGFFLSFTVLMCMVMSLMYMRTRGHP